MDCPIGLKIQFWSFGNERTNTRRVRNFSGPLLGPRGHKLNKQFLKIVDL